MCEYCREHNLRHPKIPLSSRRDEVYGAEAIVLHHFMPCEMNPTRDFWAVEAHLAGGNMYAPINYCPICGRKLEERR